MCSLPTGGLSVLCNHLIVNIRFFKEKKFTLSCRIYEVQLSKVHLSNLRTPGVKRVKQPFKGRERKKKEKEIFQGVICVGVQSHMGIHILVICLVYVKWQQIPVLPPTAARTPLPIPCPPSGGWDPYMVKPLAHWSSIHQAGASPVAPECLSTAISTVCRAGTRSAATLMEKRWSGCWCVLDIFYFILFRRWMLHSL